jgi:hypothetical protein
MKDNFAPDPDLLLCCAVVKTLYVQGEIFFFFLIVFYSGMDASFPEILFILHSHGSCRPSVDCGGSRDRTRDCCVTAWFQPVDLTTELPHPHPHPQHTTGEIYLGPLHLLLGKSFHRFIVIPGRLAEH